MKPFAIMFCLLCLLGTMGVPFGMTAAKALVVLLVVEKVASFFWRNLFWLWRSWVRPWPNRVRPHIGNRIYVVGDMACPI